MTSTRRLWIYGLLLMLSALGVGGLALGLLAREQTRLAVSQQSARDTRAAAVADRARIIAENIELLVGDVQSALMTTLREAPADEPRPFLTEWQTYNPLVRAVFRTTANGVPIWGAGSPAVREWLAVAPWERAKSEVRDGFAELKEADAAVGQARGDISTNVNNYQQVRRSLEVVAKVQSEASAAYAQELDARLTAQVLEEKRARSKNDVTQGAAGVAAKPSASALANAPSGAVPSGVSPPVEPRFDWAWFNAKDGPHRFGWRELPDGTVIGFELRLEVIKARLAEVFPSNLEPGEAYVLQDAARGVWHGPASAATPLLTVPLAGSVLPGWTVVGYLDDHGAASSAGGGLVATGAALVALLVGAILLSGALLVWRVRRSEAEAALKTSFVANVSHEFKTPLTTIRLYAELLAQGRVREEEKRHDYLNTIGRETQRLARLVGNVLDFSRLEQGCKKFDRQPLDAAAELRALLDTHAPRLAEAGLRLETALPDEACPLVTDRDALQQIVLNLLDNACKYASEGGEVQVELTCDATAGATVRVADRGPGVPGAQRERIFDKFHRLDDRLTAAHGGTGLGLSIARQLARGLGGELICADRAGGGAEFVLTLPSSPTTS